MFAIVVDDNSSIILVLSLPLDFLKNSSLNRAYTLSSFTCNLLLSYQSSVDVIKCGQKEASYNLRTKCHSQQRDSTPSWYYLPKCFLAIPCSPLLKMLNKGKMLNKYPVLWMDQNLVKAFPLKSRPLLQKMIWYILKWFFFLLPARHRRFFALGS